MASNSVTSILPAVTSGQPLLHFMLVSVQLVLSLMWVVHSILIKRSLLKVVVHIHIFRTKLLLLTSYYVVFSLSFFF